MWFARVVHEPLVQFLFVGFLLFLGVAWFAPDGVEERAADASRASEIQAIRVEREALLAFVQSRTQEPDAAANARAFDALDPAARRIWIDRFVREEALVLEAKALGLDRDDELIRRRLVQKIEFLTGGLADEAVDVSNAALEAFMSERAEDYRLPAVVSFTHVFVGRAKSRAIADDSLHERAALLGNQLNRAGLGPRAALSLGDRFLYNQNYLDRTIDEVRSHFGEKFAAELLAKPADSTRWIGPIESDHGWHIVLLKRRVDARQPTVAEIARTLRTDLLNERRDAALERAIGELVSKYPVELGDGI